MKIQLKARLYDGLTVTIEGDRNTIANWLHENVLVCDPALSVGEIKDQHGATLWKHNDPQTIARLEWALETGLPVAVYNVQDATLGDDCFVRLD